VAPTTLSPTSLAPTAGVPIAAAGSAGASGSSADFQTIGLIVAAFCVGICVIAAIMAARNKNQTGSAIDGVPDKSPKGFVNPLYEGASGQEGPPPKSIVNPVYEGVSGQEGPDHSGLSKTHLGQTLTLGDTNGLETTLVASSTDGFYDDPGNALYDELGGDGYEIRADGFGSEDKDAKAYDEPLVEGYMDVESPNDLNAC